MMLWMALASASGAAAAQAPTVAVDRLPTVFVDACLDGRARFARGEVVSISFEEMPSALRNRLQKPVSGQIWQINAPGRAYLYVLNYPPGGGRSPRICGLASDEMPLKAATEALERRVDGHTLPNKLRGMQWWRPQDGYVAIATTAAQFNVVQLSWLSDKDRARAMRELRREGAAIAESRDAPGEADPE